MVRQAIAAGSFYEYNADQLKKQILGCYNSKYGPGKLPQKKNKRELLGVISPHAGYLYSGPCAAWAYKEIHEAQGADLYLLFGFSHAGGKSSISLDDWQTPIGTIKNDKDFGELLLAKTGIENDESIHAKEHSIEVQLPFLQMVNNNFKIVPIALSDDFDYEDNAKSILDVINKTQKKICIICSSDLTHYGLNYGYYPFANNTKENIYKLDRQAMDYIEKLDSYRFLDYIDETGATICGKIPIATLLKIVKLSGLTKAEELCYYTSGDITGDYGSAVGYGSFKFESK